MSSKTDIRLTELKDMISQLNTTIKNQNVLIGSLQETLQSLQSVIAAKDQNIANLQAELAWTKQKLFGSSSERRKDEIPGQLDLFLTIEEGLEEPEKPAEPIEPEVVEEAAIRKERKKKPTLSDQFHMLPSRQVSADTLTEEQKICPECGTRMVPIGHEVIRTEIIYTPAKLERVEYIGTTYGCPVCKESEIPVFIKDEGIPALIPHSYVSESLAAWIMYQKYVNSMPLYRQEQEWKLSGIHISRTAMAGWVITCAAQYFQPVYDYLHRELLKRRFLMSDETPVQVLKEPERRPQTKSYIWLIRSGEDREPEIILYHYAVTRAGDNAVEFLKGMEAGYYLMADGYSGYNRLKDAKKCSCWAHVRRYLMEAIPKGHEKDYSDPAVQGVLYCNKLFDYERSYRQKGLSWKQIQKRREKDQKPIVESFFHWLEQQNPEKGTRMDRAVKYIRNRKDSLVTYLEDGRCSLSNNLSENSIRPVTVGRKNWLFSDTQAGADASMIVYTMIEMAKAHRLDPYRYLKYLLEARPSESDTDEKLKQLIPWDEKVRESCAIIE